LACTVQQQKHAPCNEGLADLQGGEPGPGMTGPTGVMPGGSRISKVLFSPGDVTLPGLPLHCKSTQRARP
jgi:hypothetical protein